MRIYSLAVLACTLALPLALRADTYTYNDTSNVFTDATIPDSASGSITLNASTSSNGGDFQGSKAVSFSLTDDHQTVDNETVSAPNFRVPEPASLALVGGGLFALAGLLRSRVQRQ